MFLRRGDDHTLSAVDQARARAAAQQRYEANRRAGSFRRNLTGESVDAHERGSVGAEIAFARLVRVEPNLLCDRMWVGSIDCTLPDTRTVDVKYTTYEDGCLLVPTVSTSRPDLYVLMKGRFPHYFFDGWVSATLLRQPGHITDRYHKIPCYRLPAEWLEDELLYVSPSSVAVV